MLSSLSHRIILQKPLSKPSQPRIPHKAATMAWRGSFSRSLMSTARASAFRSSTPRSAAPGLRSPPVSSSRVNSRRFSFSNPSTLGQLGCTQSLLPLHSMAAGARMTSHLAVNLRAFCELSHGT